MIDTKWGQARIDFGVVPVPGGAPGDGVLTVVTPTPKVTPKASVATSVVTPVATPVHIVSYNAGSWVGYRTEQFLSGMFHGFWNGIFG